MKILLATKLMDMGGIERSVVSLARELRARDHQVWVVSSGGYLVRDLDRDGTPHVRAPLVITSPVGVVRSALLIRRLVEEHHIDLIHSFSATSSVAVNLALLGGRKNGSTTHLVSSPMGLQNSPTESGATTWLRNWFLTLGAERILVISPEIKRYLRQVGARDVDMVDFNFVGLDMNEFQTSPEDHSSVRSEFGFPEDARIVSTIGALHPRKSHDLFIQAAARVLEKTPLARFLVVGEGELRGELERQANALGLQGKLVFTGVRDDVARLLSASDVYVKPGVVEGFIGITVLEALAVSKPVVAFDTEDVKLALTDGVTGCVVPNSDVAALADKIVYLFEHPEYGNKLGEAGKQLVSERFHFGLLAQHLEGFYRDLTLNGATNGPARRAEVD
jgi:glycosyltransferase involved in cell wall biosynthesis